MNSGSIFALSQYLCGLFLIGMTGFACKKSIKLEENDSKSASEASTLDAFEDVEFDPTNLNNLENYCEDTESSFSICNPQVITSLLSQPTSDIGASSFGLGAVDRVTKLPNLVNAIVRIWESRAAIKNIPNAVKNWIQIIIKGRSIEIPVRYKPTPERAKKTYDGLIATRNKLTAELSNSTWRDWDWIRGRYYLSLKDPVSGKPISVLVKGGYQSIEADCTGKGCQKIAEALAMHFSHGEQASLPKVFNGVTESWNTPEIQLKGTGLWLNQNFYNAHDYRYKSNIDGITRIRLSIGRQNAIHPNSPEGSPSSFLKGLQDALMTPEVP